MRRDRVVALVLAAVGVFAWTEAQRYGALSRLFPQVVALALVVLSLVLLAESFTVRARRAAKAYRSQRADGEKPDVRGVILSLLVIVAWTLLLEPLGFWITSVLAFAVLVFVLRAPDQRAAAVWKTVFAGALLVTAFVLLFRLMLRVPLPQGVLW
ncbi:MAG: hypothetical protein EA384_14840 [Spirochaetaceae bacterium]|nr:MAG: hypothetical protein EA384_14840 [Spirochaetaceae bacterium]